MSQRTVTHQIKLPLSLTIILGLIAFGLVASVLKPVLNIDKAFAGGEVHRIAICNQSGEACAGITDTITRQDRRHGGGGLKIAD